MIFKESNEAIQNAVEKLENLIEALEKTEQSEIIDQLKAARNDLKSYLDSSEVCKSRCDKAMALLKFIIQVLMNHS